MTHAFTRIAFTDAVKALQVEDGSRDAYARHEAGPPDHAVFGALEAEFIAARDSFYIATTNADGWPYIQHRGGPPGLLKLLDATTLGFADFRGNRQHITEGNLAGNDRVALFLMDYSTRTRLKLLGHASVTHDPALLARLAMPGYRGKVERGVLIRLAGFDWNCSQHITPRFTVAELEAMR
jgi:predicted pyridoxine 5'-phosphate oxidase superfamily flavin-nucleotide-binding protein